MNFRNSVRQGKKYILIVDDIHPLLMKKLESVGMVCEYLPEISYEEAKRIIHRYYGLVIRSRFNVDRQFIDCAGNLRFIARAGSGLENIDVLHAKDRGIACFNSPEGNRDAVGEHALGLLLAVVNKICSADREVRDGKWNRKSNWGTELKGKTIGIIGYGNTGSALAEKLSGLGTKVISYDKYKTGYSDAFTEETGMDRIFEETEILSFHVPLTDETVNLVDCNYIDRFKKPFIIINTSRGGIIKTEDLTDALQDGRITGAGLDVLEYEGADFEALNFYELQQSFQYLRSSSRVVLTPHVAGWTFESYLKHSEILAEKIITLCNTNYSKIQR